MAKRSKWPVVVGVVVLCTPIVILLEMVFGPNSFGDANEKRFYVSRGQPFSAVVDSLEAAGIIRSRSSFVFVAKLHGNKKIHIGKYKFDSGISNYRLFRNLAEGKETELIRVTLPEGMLARVYAQVLARGIGIDSSRFVALVHNDSLARSLGISAHSLEGYLFPETYNFSWQPDERDVITHLVRHFTSFYNDSLHVRASELGWTTNQVMTLASIVEGESVLPEERPVISGVYHNRLRRGMKLEADPTIRFLIEDGPRRILYSDLEVDNPYNTYRKRGLPPGPINNPGAASIRAALWPANHDYLFFVSNGRGGHWFSSNYSEHTRYVRKYRRERRLRLGNAVTGIAKRPQEP